MGRARAVPATWSAAKAPRRVANPSSTRYPTRCASYGGPRYTSLLIRVDLSLPRSAPGINHSAAGLDPSDTLIRIDRVGFIGLDRTRLRRARTDAIDPKESLA